MFTTDLTFVKSKTSTKYLQLVVLQPAEEEELALRLKSEVWPFEEEEEVVVVVV
jgi:hypothetical protein